MIASLVLTAVMCADPKPVSGSEYYLEAIEVLDNAKNDKAMQAAIVRLNKKWAKKRIVVEFQVTNVINNIAYINALEKSGDWRTFVFQSWLPQRAQPGDTIVIYGTPVIGETKAENEIGTLHGGGKSIKYRVDRSKLEHKPAMGRG